MYNAQIETHLENAPYVVVFFYEGTELRARIRNVQSQEQWIMRNASPLRDVLAGRLHK